MTVSRNRQSPRPVGKYVVYDPPADGLPHVAVLFMPGERPRAFLFETGEEAEAFFKINVIEKLEPA